MSMERIDDMRKALAFTALLASACVADAANVAVSGALAAFDTRTQGIGVLLTETEIDARGLTFDVSADITLDTRIPLATLILVR